MPYSNSRVTCLTAALAVLGAVIVFSFTSSCSRQEPVYKEEKKVSRRSAPLIEQDVKKAVPLEELDVNADDPAALAILGDRYFESGNYDQAIVIYEKVLSINPQDFDTYNDLGLAYHYTGKSASAVETLRKGTEINPSFQRIWLSLGFVLLSTGQTEDAKPALQKAAEINPDNDVAQEAQRMLKTLQ